MLRLKEHLKRLYNSVGKYIGSSLFKTAVQVFSGFIILRWLDPENIGQWQSFTIYVGYLNIFTLGVTSGINRELPYWLGKGDKQIAMDRLATAGYFISYLSLSIIALTILCSIIFALTGLMDAVQMGMMILAFLIGGVQIQTTFLGATFRSLNDFNKLANIQFWNSFLYILLIPLVYLYEIWGYIAYQCIISILIYLCYKHFRPHKVQYKFDKEHFVELIRVGFQIFIWNYVVRISKSIPRLILVIFGTPLLVGLFAPASSINEAMLKLPVYINRYLFPQMSFKYGENDSKKNVYEYATRATLMLLPVMLLSGVTLVVIVPYIFPIFFPKYVDGILVAQIMIFSGVFYSINLLFHNALSSLKMFKSFKFIVSFRVFYVISSITILYFFTKDLLLSVAIGAVIVEILNFFNYLFFFRKVKNE